MFISQAAAQEIVEDIGREIQQHINLMDEHGFIIASTNSGRIGQLHQGALTIIQNHLPELIVTQEMETESMHMGINLPLIVLDSIVGVVGITGQPEQVSHYGKIVKHMTEIMITDSIRKNTRRYGHRVSYRFLEEWIEASSIPVYENHFVQRGLHLGIDITKQYRILAMTYFDYTELSFNLEGQELIETMEASVRHEAERNDYIYLRKPPNQFLFISECSDDELDRISIHFRKMIQEKYNQLLVLGYDSSYSQHRNMKKSCQESVAALHYALHTSREYAGYDSLGIHFLVQQLPTDAKTDYIDHFCRRIPTEKMEESLQIIDAYFKYDGSLQKMSDALFLHKNTLQYRLKKLEEYTGVDIRSTAGCASYYVFLTIYQGLQTE